MEKEQMEDNTLNEEVSWTDAEVVENDSDQISSDGMPSNDDDFPLTVEGEELIKGMGSEDPALFMEGMAESGLIVGRIVSLQLKNLKAKFDRAKLLEVNKDSLVVGYLNKESKTYQYTDIKQIEVLHKGQRIATHELRYPMYGVSEENIKPYLKQLTSGEETHVDVVKEDGKKLKAKLRVYRSTDAKSKGVAMMYAVYGADELVIKDIPKLGIVFTDEMKTELLEKRVLSKPYIAAVKNDDGTVEERKYKIAIDEELNIVRLQRVYPKLAEKENMELSKSVIVKITKYLQQNGFKGAWTDLSAAEKIKEGVLLNKSALASATIVFKEGEGNGIPFLNVVWKAPEDQGVGKKAYTEEFKPALALVKDFLKNGLQEATKQGNEEKETLKSSQSKKQNPGMRVS